ncbi:hypothetical protein AB3X52_08160 [Nocardioides sp. DS6]|uniref:Uncharacterized protein n=1 Tax=Nocardioides eburneus TaxID=3231482 RepID=A0ABV3SXK0_9ACTN
MTRRAGLRAAAALGLLGAGFVVGLSAVALHARWWGLALGAVATLAALVALPPGLWSRASYAVGWLVALGLAMVPRPEGDYAVASDAPGYLLIGVGLVLLVGALATLPVGRRRSR